MTYFIVEVRWDAYRDDGFAEIDTSPVVGTMLDAHLAAELYLTRHASTEYTTLDWLQGIPDKNGKVYYANLPFVTFRIRQ